MGFAAPLAAAGPLAGELLAAGAPSALGALGGSALGGGGAALGLPALEAGLLGGSSALGLPAMTGLGMDAAGSAATAAAPYAAGMGAGMGAGGAWQQALASGLPAGAGTAAPGMPWGKMAQAAGLGLALGDNGQQPAPVAPLPQSAGTPTENMADIFSKRYGVAGLDPISQQLLLMRMQRGML